MVRNIVVLGGSSHPNLTETICDQLGLPPGNGQPIEIMLPYEHVDNATVLLSKFSVGETRVEIKESVRVSNAQEKSFHRFCTPRCETILASEPPFGVET